MKFAIFRMGGRPIVERRVAFDLPAAPVRAGLTDPAILQNPRKTLIGNVLTMKEMAKHI